MYRPRSFTIVSEDRPGGLDSRPAATGMSNKSRVRVERYEPKHKICWDDFVRQSKNGVFLFYRDYLEYHAIGSATFHSCFSRAIDLLH